jgi:site-specific DNA-adenine methylase
LNYLSGGFLIKFLPSYVGSKSYWVDFLLPYKNEDFVELFSGSAVLSANLAKTAILNDLDPFVYKIFSNYNNLIVPEIFTKEDYFSVRVKEDWWKYIYCLQKMSFSGVFRYSKNGYNVPIKKNHLEISIRKDFEESLKRFNELNPKIYNKSYDEISDKDIKDKVLVLDPPYEKKQASYNTTKQGSGFDYKKYWNYVNRISKVSKTTIIFDTKNNIEKNLNVKISYTRKMRVNGKHEGDLEAMYILGENRC